MGMSRFLTSKKFAVILVLLAVILTILLFKLWLLAGLLAILCSIALWLNWYIRRSIMDQVPNVQIFRQRNLDFMIIGEPSIGSDIIDNIQSKSGLQFTASTRTLASSILILKRMFSYLRPGGVVYFVGGDKFYNSTSVSCTEIPFLHRITVNSLNLMEQKRRLKFPLFFFPLESIRFILSQGKAVKRRYLDIAPDQTLVDFCVEREIDIIFKKIIK